MAGIRGQLGNGELSGVVRAAFGVREPVSVERLRGGSKKGVYRLVLDDRTTSIACVWNADEDYWPDAASPDRSRSLLAGEVAVLEDVRGGTLEALWDQDPRRAGRVSARLGDVVRTMHDSRRDRHGRPGVGRIGGTDPVEQLVLRRCGSAYRVRLDSRRTGPRSRLGRRP